ncbi:S-layer homology domain-containing protein, partial [Paenibacillus sp. NPDC058071]|uniref:S-layer homology domain-containing protein n=1 Tax=Paenibacillus sp. NPDC058071 TaxID=3346326 RepID=UPI0036DECD42
AQPSSSTISAGGNTTFTVTASNATGYQWQVDQGAGFTNITNGAPYSGATTATLTITGATADMNGYLYRVVASGLATPNATSNNAVLTVNLPPSITAQPSSSTISAGGNTTFSVTASNATGYQWQVDQGAGFTNITNGAPYSGATTSTLTITGATADMSGYLYRVVASGLASPNATSNSAALTVNSPPAITSQPSSSIISVGVDTTFSVTASNATSYQWQVDQGAGFTNITNVAPYSGATTSTLTITGATADMSGYLYRVVASGLASPNAMSNSATLTVNSPPSITSQPSDTTIDENGTASFTAAASDATSYQWQVDQGAGFTNITNGAPYSGATTPTLTITGATAAMNSYAYRLVASGAASPDAVSNSATLTVNPIPGTTVLSATSGDSKVSLAWSPVPGSTGYKIYQSTAAGNYGAEILAVGQADNTAVIKGLANGTTYYFAVKALNGSLEGAYSNQASAIPATVPAAPTGITVIAGNGEATISFTAPAGNGGSAVTGYEVTSTPGNITVEGVGSPIKVTGLTNGISYTFVVRAINNAGKSESSALSNAVTPIAPTNPNNGGTSPSAPGGTVAETGTPVWVNGKEINAGKTNIATVNGRTVASIVVDSKKLEDTIEQQGQNAVIKIVTSAKADAVIAVLNGQLVKDLGQKQAVIVFESLNAKYTIPAQQINIESIAEKIDKSVALQDIKIQIEVSVSASDMMSVVQNAATKQSFSLIAQPLSFAIHGVYGDQTIEAPRFNVYAKRTIAIPEGVDPHTITTGIVIEPDGSVRHAPTKVIKVDGKYYAEINSLSEGVFAVVEHNLEFQDVKNHWAEKAVHAMGSRMIIGGTGKGIFDPDRNISRAEFAAIIVRGLGLKPVNGTSAFSDVKSDAWYNSMVNTAYTYQLISGFEDGSFHPNDRITREQAMVMISKAMEITGLKQSLATKSIDESLFSFADAGDASTWAKSGIADSIQAGIISGRSSTVLAPKAYITRAEVAVIIERLLQKSDLI